MIYIYIIIGLLALPLVLVGIGLPFKVDKGMRLFKDGSSTQQYELPNWLRWLHNIKDGLTGDKRGWFWNIYMSGWPDWLKMLVWSGFRNPFNYLKRNVIGIDIRKYTFHKIAGQDYVRDDMGNTGFQILVARPKGGGFPRPMLYWVRTWGDSTRAIVWQWGWKIKLSHNDAVYEDEYSYWKGLTFEPQMVKNIA